MAWTRAFSAKFKIERARVAKHNKLQTYFWVAYATYLVVSTDDFVPENWPQAPACNSRDNTGDTDFHEL